MSAANCFTFSKCCRLTATGSTKTTTVPAGNDQIFAYNGGTDTLFFKWAASIALPTADTWTDGVTACPPGTTQCLGMPIDGGSLSYIAVATGGEFILGTGQGN